MPEEKIPVYVYHNGIIDKKIYERGTFYSGEIRGFTPLGKVSDVTHWMYVPSPAAPSDES